MRRFLISNSLASSCPGGYSGPVPKRNPEASLRKFIPLLLLAASFTQLATATSVLVIDGPDSSESHAGWYSLLGEYLSQSWTQSTALLNVSISAAVFTDGSSGTAEAYLSTQIGPSTTAGDVIASAPLTLSVNGDALFPIFSGLDLSAGTYYLTIVGLTTNVDDGWRFTSNSNVASTPDITYNGGFYTETTSAIPVTAPGYVPFGDQENSGRMEVEGTPAQGTATPEPGTFVPVCVAFAMICWSKRTGRRLRSRITLE
jgi:hypothetical protein